MRVIGITGGIGSGKSTVSGYIRSLGFDVIDADGIARDLACNKDVMSEIHDFFGDAVFCSDGSLDRKRMAEIVFSDIMKRELLENIITSRVVSDVTKILAEYRNGQRKTDKDMVFLDAPTLFETGADRLVDEVWVVLCDVEKRIERAGERDHATVDEIGSRIASQMPDDERAEKADEIIVNNSSVDDLYRELDKLIAEKQQN